MFSYMSSKGSQSTLENNLIEQIQSMANDIFDYQRSSLTRTELQQISLEFSSASDQDNKNSQLENLVFKNQTDKYLSPHPHDHQLIFQQPINHTTHLNSYKQNNSENNQEHSFRRLTKSMVSGHLLSKEPGSFSNHYNQAKNISASNITPVPKRQQVQKEENLSLSALNPTNPNKENILMGILGLANKKRASSKTPNKRGKFSTSYASNYLSPYSTKGIKQNPKSYMQKSNTQINACARKQKQTIELQYIKQRLNQNIQPQISYRKQKQERNRLKNPKLSNIKSKYKQTRPIMQDYKLYADQHIIKKIKNQMAVWQHKKKQYQTLSNYQIQSNWQQFIQKQHQFLQQKKKTILTKQLQNFNQQSVQLSNSPSKNFLKTKKSIEVTPPKMTPEDYIKKYKRQKQKLKEKLEANQIANFVSKSYQNMKMFGKQIFQSVWGNSVCKQSQMQSFHASNTSGQYLTNQENSNYQADLVAKLLIESNAPSNKKTHENFFISVGEQSYKSLKKKPKERNSSSYQTKMMARSFIHQKSKSIGRSNSRQPKSANRQSNSAKQDKGINSLSPFIKKQSYFTSKQMPPEVYEFDARQHNSPFFNEQLRKGKSKSKTKNDKINSNTKISELLNPKYFKSINELEEYVSTSRQKSDQMRRTFEGSKVNSKEGEYSLELQEKEMTFKQFKKSDKKKNNRDSISAFDSKLMTKIIHDLDHMRSEIEENKKKRQYRIENYRNFSNLRKNQGQSKLQTDQSLPIESGLKKSNNSPKKFGSYEREDRPNQMAMRRENHRFKTAVNQEVNQSRQVKKGGVNKFASRSISPIEREDSILINGNNLSLSMIQPRPQIDGHSVIKNLQFSQFSSRMANSSMIMVKNREQVDFIVKE